MKRENQRLGPHVFDNRRSAIMRSKLRSAVLAATGLGGAVVAGPAFTQSAAPIARYTMDAETVGGFGAMGQGGGMAAAMAAMRGQGGAAAHNLLLRLGSSRAPTGAATAQHTLPQTARFGPTLPLTYQSGPSYEGGPGQMPKGRLLLFWGCGEHAPAGQPLVIDFSKMAKGQVPPGLYAKPLALAEEWRVTAANSKTYGEWPNASQQRAIPANASLLGAHKVTGNYTPDINFTLDQDFMAPVALNSRALPSGAFALSWNALPTATGYYAWAFSAKDQDRSGNPTEMVWWTSSASQAFGGPMWDWLSPAAVRTLIAAKTVMPPNQTNCTVPAEVKKAGGEVTMGSLYAYGPERTFAFPPRPSDPKVAWKPEWIARARFRSMSMAMLGMDMGAMGGMDMSGSDDDDAGAPPPRASKPKCKGGLAGIAQRAAGLCE
jgi:hypothetical protein